MLSRQVCCCSGGCGFTVCVVSCGSLSIISGATVQAKSSGTVVASGTTTGAGCVMLMLPSAGTYELVITKSGYSTFDASVTMSCGGNKTVKLYTAGSYSACWTVTGCCGNPVVGATISVGGAMLTTDSTGKACWGTAIGGSYSWTITAPCSTRLNTYSGTLTFSDCAAEQDFSVTMTAVSGYHCGVVGDPCPIPATLNLTDSVYGGAVLTWDGGGWSGSATASFPGCSNFGVGCPAASFIIDYRVSACVAGTTLSVGYSACDYGVCNSGSFTAQSQGCPCTNSDNCTGKPNGTLILDYLGTIGPVSFRANGINTLSGSLVVTSTNPFDATQVMTPTASNCGIGGNSSIYPAGVTFTLTE